MRCIVVRAGNLKADAHCAYCHQQIGDNYARKIGTRFLYCDFDCFQNAEEATVLARKLPIKTWTVNS